MLKKLFIFVLLIFANITFAQINPSTITLDTAITNAVKSKSFYLKNPSNKVIQITNIRTLSGEFYSAQSPFNINPFDSVLVTINFKTKQNITYRNFFIFENTGLNYPLIYYVTGTAKYSDALYSFTQGLIDEPLKAAIKTFTTTGHIPLTYNTARDAMYGTIDHYESPDTIECVYTGRKAIVRTRTEATAQNFNCEHTWPQSFFNSNSPMVCDLFHLYPTDDAANNARSNYPFGVVTTVTGFNVGGSKLGTDSQGTIVFEPRDVHKGNVARSLFYFVVTYQNDFGNGLFMNARQDSILRVWNTLDTVDAKEILRNTRIHTAQNTWNPFIAHPELVERIKSTFTTANTVATPKISASPFNVVYDTLAANDTSSYYVAIMNKGTATLNITTATSNASQFIVESVPASVPAKELRYIKIKFKPTSTNQTYTGILTVQNSDSTITINLKGSSNSATGINQISSNIPDNFDIKQNYPNPFNPTTKINFDIPKSSYVTMKVYDLTGREVSALISQNFEPGSYSMNWNASSLTSGVYYIRILAGDFSKTIKTILSK